jgi:hypothetical protein
MPAQLNGQLRFSLSSFGGVELGNFPLPSYDKSSTKRKSTFLRFLYLEDLSPVSAPQNPRLRFSIVQLR